MAYTPASRSHSSYLQCYVEYLKEFYTQKRTPVYDKEPLLLQFKSKSYINIALVHKNFRTTDSDKKNEMIMDRLCGHVDAIQKKKTELNICDVCKCEDGSLAHSVLVEGSPGVGKTTFAFELCKQWAGGEALHNWKVVLVVKLRDQRARKAKNLCDLLYHPDPEVKQLVTKELIDQYGEGLLLILDGYDELSDSQREFTSIIQQLMSRELLCKATLMVTSRPIATRTLHSEFLQSIDQHIEVLGFTEENISEYIHSACRNKPDEMESDFKSYLSSHPFSFSIMFNPLQCAIVTDLYLSHWNNEKKRFAPKTLTELYTGLFHTLLLRYLSQHPVHKEKDWWLNDLSDLPGDVEQHVIAIAKLAAEGIENQQYVFDETDGQVPLQTLGLMQREEEIAAGVGRSASYYFLHLTLQEYLAAVYFSNKCNTPEQLSQLLVEDRPFLLKSFLKYYSRKEISSQSTKHWPVMLFLAGKTKLVGVSADLLQTGLLDRGDETEVDVSLLHLLYETQSSQLIQSTLVTTKKYLSASGDSPLDWFVIGYCIANSVTVLWRIKAHCTEYPHRVIRRRRKQQSKQVKLTNLQHLNQLPVGITFLSKTVSINGSKIGSLEIKGFPWQMICEVLEGLKFYIENVTEMILCGSENNIKIGIQNLSLCYSSLKRLSIEDAMNAIPSSILIKSPLCNFHSLHLEDCSLDSEATCLLIHCLRSPQCKLGSTGVTLKSCRLSIPNNTDYTDEPIISCDVKSGEVALDISASIRNISVMLMQLHFFAKRLVKLVVRVQDLSSTTLEVISSNYPILRTLEIINKCWKPSLFLSSSVFSFGGCLHTLLIRKCYLNFYVASILIYRVQHLTLEDSIISTCDDIYQVSFQFSSRNALYISSNIHVINYVLFHFPYTSRVTKLNLNVQSDDPTLMVVSSNFSALENNMKVYCQSQALSLSSSIFNFSSQQILHSLSLKKCNLNSEVTYLLIKFLQSPHCQLDEILIEKCSAFVCEGTNDSTSSCNLKLQSKSLKINGSSEFISCLLSKTDHFGLKFQELYIEVSTVNSPLEMNLGESMLNTLQITNATSLSLVLCGSLTKLKYLNELSVSGTNLDHSATISIIHLMLSPCYQLSTAILDNCTIYGESILTTTSHKKCSYKEFEVNTSSYVLFLNYLQRLDLACSKEWAENYTNMYVSIVHSSLEVKVNLSLRNTWIFCYNINSEGFGSLSYSIQSILCRVPQNNELTRIFLYIYTQSKCKNKTTHAQLYSSVVEYYKSAGIFFFTGPAHLLSSIFVPMHVFTNSLKKIRIRYERPSLFPLETLHRVTSSCSMLESLDINYCDSEMGVSIFSLDIKKVCSALVNNICTLSLQLDEFSGAKTMILLSFQNSPKFSPQRLSLEWCFATYNDSSQLQTVVSSIIDKVPNSILEKVPLKITGSCQFTHHTLSQLHHSDYMMKSLTIDLEDYSNTLSAELNIIPSNYPMLQLLQVNIFNSPFFTFNSQQANYHTLQLFHYDADSETEQRAQGLSESMILYGETVHEFTIHYCNNEQELPYYELKMMAKDAKGVQFDIIDKYEHL